MVRILMIPSSIQRTIHISLTALIYLLLIQFPNRRVLGRRSPRVHVFSFATNGKIFRKLKFLSNKKRGDQDGQEGTAHKLTTKTRGGSYVTSLRASNKNENGDEEQQEDSISITNNRYVSPMIENELHMNESDNSKMELMVYADPYDDGTLELWGLNVDRNKFDAYVNYILQDRPMMDFRGRKRRSFDSSFVTVSSLKVDNEAVRSQLRLVWKDARLITEKTDVLAMYQSDVIHNHEMKTSTKRGGFADMIAVYTDRLISILKEEKEDDKRHKHFLLDWMRKEYGIQETNSLSFGNIRLTSENNQLQTLQHFLSFFRATFPYYHDRCAHCGKSTHDEPATGNEDAGDGHFVGYVYPSQAERNGKATRTELYLCKHCNKFTRFPRYNSVTDILEQKRGRCGEYAMLLFRFMRCLGYESRWVVDWSDHLWVEVLLPFGSNGHTRWVHLDPCEAVVNEPLLYESWGKKQTYIMAFQASKSDRRNMDMTAIEDVTKFYTSDNQNEINKRRSEEAHDIQSAIEHESSRLMEQSRKISGN